MVEVGGVFWEILLVRVTSEHRVEVWEEIGSLDVWGKAFPAEKEMSKTLRLK